MYVKLYQPSVAPVEDNRILDPLVEFFLDPFLRFACIGNLDVYTTDNGVTSESNVQKVLKKWTDMTLPITNSFPVGHASRRFASSVVGKQSPASLSSTTHYIKRSSNLTMSNILLKLNI